MVRPTAMGTSLIRYFLKHRQDRENTIKSTLTAAPRSIDQLLPEVYADVSESVYPIASRALLAGLIKLEEDGFSKRQGGRMVAGLNGRIIPYL